MCDRRDLGTAIGERPPAPDSGSSGVGAQHAAPLHCTIDSFTASRMKDAISSNPKEFFEPNLYLYDAYPGGIGFSEPLFRTHTLLMQKTRELIASCPCEQGCPSCVGPAGDLVHRAKEAALAILDRLCA
jgi:DEAD/DEAH box helicase domain-containing protein